MAPPSLAPLDGRVSIGGQLSAADMKDIAAAGFETVARAACALLFSGGAASLAAGRSLDEVLAAAMRAGQNLEPIGETMTALTEASR